MLLEAESELLKHASDIGKTEAFKTAFKDVHSVLKKADMEKAYIEIYKSLQPIPEAKK